MIVERVEFQTAAQLVAALEKMAGGILRLDEVYLKDAQLAELSLLELEQETLSDGSVVFNMILSQQEDPNS